MKFHPYADLFPMMPEMDLMRLAEDIKEKGQSDPIITFEDQILDGRNRFKACGIVGAPPRMQRYEGDDALGFVISHNLHRRHLTESQRAMVAAKIANLSCGNFSKSAQMPISPVSQTQAAEMLNVSSRTIREAKQVQRNGAPELVAAIENGDIKVKTAKNIAMLPHAEQRKVVAAGPEAIRAKAKELKVHVEPEPEPEPLVIDNSKKRERIPNWIPDDAERLWLLAKTDLDKILPQDRSRERVLQSVITYAQNRIENNK